MAKKTVFEMPPRLEDAPKLQLIEEGVTITPCLTCGAGAHTKVEGEPVGSGREWTRCSSCDARALSNHQIDDANNVIYNGAGQALVGACMGSRKTGTSVAIMNQLQGTWLVVVPLHTMEQWEKAVHEWAPRAEVRKIVASNKTGLVDLEQAWKTMPFSVHLIGWETFRNRDFEKFRHIDGAILDESHRASNIQSLTAKKLAHVNAEWRIALSGTPANNKLHGLYPILNWIWWGPMNKVFPHRNRFVFRRFELYLGTLGRDNQRAWLRRHFELEESQYGGPFSYEVGAEKQFHSVINEIPLYIQHLEDETCCRWHPGGVNASLPERLPTKFIYVDMTPAQAKLYKRADDPKQTMVWLNADNGQIAPTVTQGSSEYLRKLQIALAVPSLKKVTRTVDGVATEVDCVYMEEDASSGSIDALISLLTDIVEPGDPVLVWTHSNVFARIVVERLRKAREFSFPVALWNGDTKPEERELIKDWFGLPGGPQVIVATVKAIAEGTDGLQDRCRRSVALSWDDNMTLNVQLGILGGGRLRRTGQTRTQQHWEIQMRDTIQVERYNQMLQERAILNDSLKVELAQPTYTL